MTVSIPSAQFRIMTRSPLATPLPSAPAAPAGSGASPPPPPSASGAPRRPARGPPPPRAPAHWPRRPSLRGSRRPARWWSWSPRRPRRPERRFAHLWPLYGHLWPLLVILWPFMTVLWPFDAISFDVHRVFLGVLCHRPLHARAGRARGARLGLRGLLGVDPPHPLAMRAPNAALKWLAQPLKRLRSHQMQSAYSRCIYIHIYIYFIYKHTRYDIWYNLKEVYTYHI